MKTKIIMTALAAFACMGMAEAASEKYTATVTPRIFKVSQATSQRPVPLTATTPDGCSFDIAMVVIKMDDGSLTATGRVTGGQCHGKSVSEGIVLGSIADQDDYGTVELAPTVDVVLLK